MKKEKGITLIALVVTIVVLLILATTSIAMLTGENGILKQAKDSREKTNEANAKERVELEVQGSYNTERKINLSLLNENLKRIEGLKHRGKTLEENPIEKLPAEVELDGYKIEIKGNLESNETQGLPMPSSEAVISKIKGEYEDINEGIVIYIIPEDEKSTVDWTADTNNNDILDVQEKYDQFVWVPVPNAVLDLSADTEENKTVLSSETNIKEAVQNEINAGRYPMAIKKDVDNYVGVLYQFDLDTTSNSINITPHSEWTALGIVSGTEKREPAYLTSYNMDPNTDSEHNNVGITLESLQGEYNTMVENVKKNGGFWVGRYETSQMNGSSDDIKTEVVKGTNIGIGNVNWYRMYQQQKNYSNKANISLTSSMIWGSQWDQIMIWMKNVKNESRNSYYVIDSLGMANFTSSILPTGYYKVKNIYDLSGNVSDWTLEASGNSVRVMRGGQNYFIYDTFRWAGARMTGSPPNYSGQHGTRLSLY